MALLLRKEITNPYIKGNGYVYEVWQDPDGEYEVLNDEYASEDVKGWVKEGTFKVYAVCKIDKCKCCSQDIRDSEDWICGITAEDEEEALEYYISEYA